MDFDTGDDAVEVIARADFYDLVLKQLGLNIITQAPEEIVKMDRFLAEIGALAKNSSVPEGPDSQVIRFDILRSAWQVHGYQFSNLRKLRKLRGLNFNMLNVKSVRVMNRLAKKVDKFK